MSTGSITARSPLPSPTVTRRQLARRTLNRALGQGGMTLLVDGEAGMGKTYVLRELGAASQAAVFIRADEFESREPYSFMERFISSELMSDWLFIPDGQTNPVEVARECIRRLVRSTAEQPRVILIDDAQWIDQESQRVLRYVIPRVTRRGVFLAFAVRSPHAPGSFGEFLTELVHDSPPDAAVHVGPLTVPEVSALVVERLNVGVSAATAEYILEHTGGSFLEVDSMLASLTPQESAQLHLAWNPRLRTRDEHEDPLLYRFFQLSPEARSTCEVVCVAGHEISRDDLALVHRKLGAPVRVAEGLEAGVLIETGREGVVLPRHALVAEAVKERLPRERARSISLALAAVTSGYRSLKHTLLGSSAWEPDLRARVTVFVEEAANSGGLEIACDVLRSALEVAEEPADRAELLESLTLMHLRAKNAYLVLDFFDEITALPHSVLHEFMVVVLSAHRVGHEIPHERAAALLATRTDSPDEQTILAFTAFMAVMLTMRSQNRAAVPQLIEFAKRLISHAPAHQRELHDPRLGWMVAQEEYLVVLDCYRMVEQQIHSETAEVLGVLPSLTDRVVALPDGPYKVDGMLALAGAYLAVGDPVRGRDLAQQGVDLLARVSEPWAASTARLILADCFIIWGEYDRATELIELTEEVSYTSVDVETRSSWAALRVMVAAATGHDDADNFVELAKRQRELSWEGYGPDLGILACCELARVRQDPEEILAITSGRWAEEVLNTRHGFLTYRVHALLDTGRLDEAEELITRLAEWRGSRWQEYWGSLHWLRARLAQLRGDDETALWHYEAAAEVTDFPLPHGLTLTHFGEFLRARGDVSEGMETLREAFRVLDHIGAKGYLAPLREALKGDGAGKRSFAQGQLLAALTEREQQIAAQLAKGRSNNQIAESLVVSVTTVRSHVSNVLRKLRLSSRGEVAKLFRDSAPASQQVVRATAPES